ncbi:MAG: transcriptional repressor, partial [Calditerricola sp.]|nr:transcriptional repressor [Calditerricola sp.]
MRSHRLEKAIEKLKANGVRITPQRYAILAYLIESMSHPTADEIYKALEKQF